MGRVIEFPKQKQPHSGYSIPLYNETEVGFVIAAINIFGTEISGGNFTEASRTNLRTFTPLFVMKCLGEAYRSDMFSIRGKDIIRNILINIEKVKIAQ